MLILCEATFSRHADTSALLLYIISQITFYCRKAHCIGENETRIIVVFVFLFFFSGRSQNELF